MLRSIDPTTGPTIFQLRLPALLLVGPATLSAAIAIFLKPIDSKIIIPLWILAAAALALILLLIKQPRNISGVHMTSLGSSKYDVEIQQ